MTRAQKKLNRLFEYYNKEGRVSLREDHVITKTLFSFVVDGTKVSLNEAELKLVYSKV